MKKGFSKEIALIIDADYMLIINERINSANGKFLRFRLQLELDC